MEALLTFSSPRNHVFYGGKEFHPLEEYCGQGPQCRRQKKNPKCLRPPPLVSSKCLEDVAVQFVVKQGR